MPDRPICGLTLISPEYALTAAHCVILPGRSGTPLIPANEWIRPTDFFPHQFVVRLGDHNLLHNSWEPEIDVPVKAIVLYGTNIADDIAMLKLDFPVQFCKSNYL